MKTTICITIDVNLLTELKLRNVNISQTINRLLIDYLEINRNEIILEDYSPEIIKAEIKLNDLKLKQQLLEREREKKQKEKEEFDNLDVWEKLRRGHAVEL